MANRFESVELPDHTDECEEGWGGGKAPCTCGALDGWFLTDPLEFVGDTNWDLVAEALEPFGLKLQLTEHVDETAFRIVPKESE